MNFLLLGCYSSGRIRENAWGLLERSPQTPKNFQNVNIIISDASFDGIFVIFVLEEPALLIPEIAKTPSRGPLSPLFGGKGRVLRGAGELEHWGVTVQVGNERTDPQELSKQVLCMVGSVTLHILYRTICSFLQSFHLPEKFLKLSQTPCVGEKNRV